jgi:hypothetical protein
VADLWWRDDARSELRNWWGFVDTVTGIDDAPQPEGDVTIRADNNSVAAWHIDNVYQTPGTAYEVMGREEYLSRTRSIALTRKQARRRGAGLTPEQVERSLGMVAVVPTALEDMLSGSYRVLTGPLGAGKSDIAEEWFRHRLARAAGDPDSPVPLWISANDLAVPLENQVVAELGLNALETVGCDLVVDGLDERTDRAGQKVRQAEDFIRKWPKSRVVLTSRQIPAEISRIAFGPDVVVEAPSLPRSAANRLMSAIAGRQVGPLGPELEDALGRPLFAILIARHASAAEGSTGLPELIDLVVHDVVAGEGWDLYRELRKLAVATVRKGRAVDPAAFESSDVAERIRSSPLVTANGKRCSFALATFEQWFAAKALLEGEVGIEEVLTSMKSFDRWKYVIAMVLAAGEPSRVDPMMAALARWNPGAAAWVIQETHRGGLTRTRSEIEPEDWEEVGERLRLATEAWLDGLGPILSTAFFPFRRMGTTDFAKVTVAVEVDHRLSVAWLANRSGNLGPVMREKKIDMMSQSFTLRDYDMPTAVNWVWEITQTDLAHDLGRHFLDVVLPAAEEHEGVVRDETLELREAWEAQRRHQEDSSRSWQVENPMYPYPDIPPSLQHRWGSSTIDTMHTRARAVVTSAMKCYLELAALVTPNFGITLAHRGLMPVEFYGTMAYRPDEPRGSFDIGPHEPGFRWMLRPTREFTEEAVPAEKNIVSINANDDDRALAIMNDREQLYSAFMQYLNVNPEFAPFAGSFTVTTGGLDVLRTRPATRIAWRWLWDDLKQLGWVSGSVPTMP